MEVWTRGEGSRWSRVLAGEGDVAELTIGTRLDVAEIYESAAEPST